MRSSNCLGSAICSLLKWNIFVVQLSIERQDKKWIVYGFKEDFKRLYNCCDLFCLDMNANYVWKGCDGIKYWIWKDTMKNGKICCFWLYNEISIMKIGLFRCSSFIINNIIFLTIKSHFYKQQNRKRFNCLSFWQDLIVIEYSTSFCRTLFQSTFRFLFLIFIFITILFTFIMPREFTEDQVWRLSHKSRLRSLFSFLGWIFSQNFWPVWY